MKVIASMSTRPFHAVVWGATGFTGRLVCEHIARDYKGGQVKWAMAGRNQEKLEQLREELSQQYGAEFKDTPILVGSIDDAASLDKIAAQASVIIGTAGPFTLYGTPLVEAALRQSCDGYVDITGEVPWVRSLIDAHHEEAAAKGVRIIPCCGYDSIPSDLGASFVVDRIQQLGEHPATVVCTVAEGKGGVSGGTIATGMLLMGTKHKDKAAAAAASSTYALIPKGTQPGKDRDFWGAKYDQVVGGWLGPAIMQVCNSRVVQRSNYLLGWGGPEFSYLEATSVGGWLAARALSAATIGMGLAMSTRLMHPLLRRLLPAPGEGPSKETRESGLWKYKVFGTSREGSVVTAEVGDPSRDPGYGSTSRMVLEAALTIALQKADLDADPKLLRGGVLTSASALGHTLVDRLRKAGFVFEVTQVQRAGGKPAVPAAK